MVVVRYKDCVSIDGTSLVIWREDYPALSDWRRAVLWQHAVVSWRLHFTSTFTVDFCFFNPFKMRRFRLKWSETLTRTVDMFNESKKPLQLFFSNTGMDFSRPMLKRARVVWMSDQLYSGLWGEATDVFGWPLPSGRPMTVAGSQDFSSRYGSEMQVQYTAR